MVLVEGNVDKNVTIYHQFRHFKHLFFKLGAGGGIFAGVGTKKFESSEPE